MLFCCPRGSIQEEPEPGNSHSAVECGGIPGAVQKHNVKARMSLEKHKLEELFSEFISSAAFPLVHHCPDQRKCPNFHVSLMLEICQARSSLSLILLPTCWVTLGNSMTSPSSYQMDWMDFLSGPRAARSLDQYKFFPKAVSRRPRPMVSDTSGAFSGQPRPWLCTAKTFPCRAEQSQQLRKQGRVILYHSPPCLFVT